MKLTNKQKELINLIITHNNTLAYGGARSGKTYGIVDAIITIALCFPNTKHLIARRYEVDIRGSIWTDTIKRVLRDKDLHIGVDYASTERPMQITFNNGSLIALAGLDDKERVDKILGTEYSTIYLNESQDIPWPTVKTLSTRLAQKNVDRRRFIFDLNPTSKNHWTYKLFFKYENPESGLAVNPDQHAKIQMNPFDNQENLPSDFIADKLETLTGVSRSRFLLGEYQSDTDIKVFQPPQFYSWDDFTGWAYTVGMHELKLVAGLDLGYQDADAFCVLAYHPEHKEIWLVYEHKARRQSLEQLADACAKGLQWCNIHIPRNIQGDIDIFADTSTIRHGKEGDSKKSASTLAYNYGMPIRPAHKADKKIMIEYLQNAVNTGQFKILRNGHFANETELTVFKKLEDGTIQRIIDDEVFHPDMMDAILYAMKYILNYNETLQTSEYSGITKVQFKEYYPMGDTTTVFDDYLNRDREVW